MGSVEGDELRHDQDSINPEPYMKEALDDLIYRLFSREKVGYPKWDLRDFILEQEDAGELAYRMATSEVTPVRDELEKRLRDYLENSETLYERAVELAGEE